jgi:resuscitation-promoting factor RpfA
MTRSRGTSRVDSTRNLARVVVAGIILAGSPLALAGTANATTQASPSTSTASPSDDVWDQIAQCESGGRWNTNTGNGFSGGLQFTPSTWRAYGGKGSAQNASRDEQIAVAERVVRGQGWGAWPVCSRKVSASAKSRHLSSGSSSTVTRETSATRQSTATRETHTQVKPQAAPKAPAQNPAPAPAPAAQPVAAGTTYTVVAGDTLSKIAQQRNLPGGWQALYQRNSATMSNANTLRVGQRITLG